MPPIPGGRRDDGGGAPPLALLPAVSREAVDGARLGLGDAARLAEGDGARPVERVLSAGRGVVDALALGLRAASGMSGMASRATGDDRALSIATAEDDDGGGRSRVRPPSDGLTRIVGDGTSIGLPSGAGISSDGRATDSLDMRRTSPGRAVVEAKSGLAGELGAPRGLEMDARGGDAIVGGGSGVLSRFGVLMRLRSPPPRLVLDVLRASSGSARWTVSGVSRPSE